MPQDLKGRWKVFLGVMTESTTERGQRWFHVYCPDFEPMVKGDVSPEEFENKITVENVFTKQKDTVKTKVTKTVYADYFGVQSCMSVPTMYKGQQVLLINYGNTDRWYWMDIDRDHALKTFENIRISALDKAVTNKSTVNDPEDIKAKDDGSITDDNTYYIDIDTKYNKRILLRTSATDGELFRYGIEIDSKANTIRLWDEPTENSQPMRATRNQIIIESKQPTPRTCQWGRITLQNACATSIILDDVDMDINVPRNFNMFVGGSFSSNIVVSKSEHVIGPVDLTHDSTFTQKVMKVFSLTVMDSMGVKVVKNLAVNVLQMMDVNVIGKVGFTFGAWIISILAGTTMTTQLMTLTVSTTWQITCNLINGAVQLMRYVGSRCGFHYSGTI